MYIQIIIIIILYICFRLNITRIRKFLSKKAYKSNNETLNEPLIDIENEEDLENPKVLLYNSPFNKSKAGFFIESQDLDLDTLDLNKIINEDKI